MHYLVHALGGASSTRLSGMFLPVRLFSTSCLQVLCSSFSFAERNNQNSMIFSKFITTNTQYVSTAEL